jgi:hypothetical protein
MLCDRLTNSQSEPSICSLSCLQMTAALGQCLCSCIPGTRLHAHMPVVSPLFSCIDSAVYGAILCAQLAVVVPTHCSHRTYLPLPALSRRRMHSQHTGRARCALCMHSAMSVALHGVIHGDARTHTRLYSFSVTFGTG